MLWSSSFRLLERRQSVVIGSIPDAHSRPVAILGSQFPQFGVVGASALWRSGHVARPCILQAAKWDAAGVVDEGFVPLSARRWDEFSDYFDPPPLPVGGGGGLAGVAGLASDADGL